MYNYSPFKRTINYNRLAITKPSWQTTFIKPNKIALGELSFPKKTVTTSFFNPKPITFNTLKKNKKLTANKRFNRNKKLFANKNLGIKKQTLGTFNNTYYQNLPKTNTLLPITQQSLLKNISAIRSPLFKKKQPTNKLHTRNLNSLFKKPFNQSYTLKIKSAIKKPFVASFTPKPTNSFYPIPLLNKQFRNLKSYNRNYNIKPYGTTKSSSINNMFASNLITNKSRFSKPLVQRTNIFNKKSVNPLGAMGNSFANKYTKNNNLVNPKWLKLHPNHKVRTLPFSSNKFNNYKQYIPITKNYLKPVSIPIKYNTQSNQYFPIVPNRSYSLINNKNKFMY